MQRKEVSMDEARMAGAYPATR